jgi:hypothetical protein
LANLVRSLADKIDGKVVDERRWRYAGCETVHVALPGLHEHPRTKGWRAGQNPHQPKIILQYQTVAGKPGGNNNKRTNVRLKTLTYAAGPQQIVKAPEQA